jgi:hypothetical protein
MKIYRAVDRKHAAGVFCACPEFPEPLAGDDVM